MEKFTTHEIEWTIAALKSMEESCRQLVLTKEHGIEIGLAALRAEQYAALADRFESALRHVNQRIEITGYSIIALQAAGKLKNDE